MAVRIAAQNNSAQSGVRLRQSDRRGKLLSIFLSHNKADKPFVRSLAKRLIESGVNVWLDEVELRIGDSIIDKIGRAIEDVDFVAAVISSNSVESAWVQRELSLALSKELRKKTVVVLPILIDDCEVPASLKDKLYADLRKPENFDQECEKLLQAMGIDASRERFVTGISVEWTDEGPRIAGPDVIISATESNALISRYFDWLPKFVESERERLGEHSDYGGAAHFLASLRACANTYKHVPDEEEIRKGNTELARKYDLFFGFLETMYSEYGPVL